MPRAQLQYIELSDFTKGIYSGYFTDTSPAVPAQDGALQERDTWGCCAGQNGGLVPLPRAKAFLTDKTVWGTNEQPDRIPIIAAKVVSPIVGATAPNLHDVTLEEDPLFYFAFEDTAGSTIIRTEIRHEYDAVLGTAPPTSLGGVFGGFDPDVYGTVEIPGYLRIDPTSGTPPIPFAVALKEFPSVGTPGEQLIVAAGNGLSMQVACALDSWGAGGTRWLFEMGSSYGIGVSGGHVIFKMGNASFSTTTASLTAGPGDILRIRVSATEPVNSDPGDLSSSYLYDATVEVAVGLDGAFSTLEILTDRLGGVPNPPSDATSPFSHNGVWVYLPTVLGVTPTNLASVGGDWVDDPTGQKQAAGNYYWAGIGTPASPFSVFLADFRDQSAASTTYADSAGHTWHLATFTANGTWAINHTYVNFSDAVPGVGDPLAGFLGYHGDFGELVGGPIIGPVTFVTVTEGFAAISDGVCGNAVALGDAYFALPSADYYSALFTLECRIKVQVAADHGGVVMLKDTATGAPLMALHVEGAILAATIFNTDGELWLEASIDPATPPVSYTDWVDYAITFDGTTLTLWADAVNIVDVVVGSAVGARMTSSATHFEVYGDIAAFDEFSYYQRSLSSFRLAIHANAQCEGGGALAAMVCVAYQWYGNDNAATASAFERIRLYRPTDLTTAVGALEPTDYYEPYSDATTFDTGDVMRYGYAGFDLTRSNKADPALVGAPFLVVLAGPALNSDDADWKLFIVPDPDTTSTDTLEMVTTGFIGVVVCHQGRIVWIGSLTGGDDFTDGHTFDIFEQIGWTEVNDHSTLVSNFAFIAVPENPTGYGAWASLNASELFLVKRAGGGVVIRNDLDNPTVVRLPGVASTGRFVNLGVDTPFGFVYGSERGVWLWTGGDACQLLSPQLHGRFLATDTLPDNYVGLHGSFTFSEPYVFAPNSWVFDTRTESWWKLRNNPDIAVELHSAFYDVDLDGNVYAFPSAMPVGADDDEHNVFAQIYDLNLGESAFSARTQPLARTRNRELEFREIILKASGVGTITITLEGIDNGSGAATPRTETFIVDSLTPVVRVQATELRGQDISAIVTSTADNPQSSAPVVHSVLLGYSERQRVTNEV